MSALTSFIILTPPMKPKKSNKVRIILLKEVPHLRNLYDQQGSRDSLNQEDNYRYSKGNRVNHTSIAYLSSILQDEHLNTDKSTAPLDTLQEPSLRSIDKLEEYRKTGKKSNRYLSCLLEAPEDAGYNQHSKTQQIDKMFQRRKIMPIDKITQRKKNITFSLKNKKELNHDFHEFVTNQASSKPQELPPSQDKETIIFSKRNAKDLSKRYASLKGEAQRRKGRRIMQDLHQIQQNLEVPAFSNKKVTIDARQPGYAIAFKRLSSDIPQLNRFEWSRLDDNSYQLIKG